MSNAGEPAAQVNVLLIEDSTTDGIVFRRALEREPEPRFVVEQAFTLNDGIAALQRSTPDCVVLDLGLPDSAGLEGLSRVLAVDVAPVIVLTGTGGDRPALEALRMGAQDYLVKDLRASPRTAHAVLYAIERRAAVNAMRQAEAESAARRQELELELAERHKLEALGVLAGGIAHDFNNLATVILGNADFLLMQLPSDALEYESAREIRQAALRAAALTKQMLAYTGDGRYMVEVVSFDDIVRGLTEPARGSIPGNATVELRLDPSTPAVQADVRQLDQLVLNLLRNAAEALDGAPGTISVRTRAVEMDRAHLARYRSGDTLSEGVYAELEITDTGAGIAADSLPKIFDPFFTTNMQRRGLGLAAVDGIVRGHGGAVRVDSEPGAGTAFNVLLPAAA